MYMYTIEGYATSYGDMLELSVAELLRSGAHFRGLERHGHALDSPEEWRKSFPNRYSSKE